MALDNRGPELGAVCYAFAAVALVSALLRFYVRLRIVKSFGVDDYFMLVSLISFLLFVASSLIGIHFGAGRHLLAISNYGREKAIMCWWFCYLWYCLAMTATKVSIGYFLLRVVVRRTHLWIIYSVMGLNILSGIAFFFITLFQCTPVSKFWNRDQPGKCLGMDAVISITYVYGACSIICDFTCTLLPIFIIWGLNMDKRSKVALMPVMALACVASSATVVRFAYCKDAKDPDFLYATINIVIWSTIEQGLAVTAGSLATLRPLLRSLAQKLGFTSARPSELKDSDYHDRFQYGRKSKNNPEISNGEGLRLAPIKDHEGRLASATASDSYGKTNTSWEARVPPNNESEEELTALNANSISYSRGKSLRVTTLERGQNWAQ